MKVIDIFKNIADGKEVPKKIKFNYKTYIYKPEWKDYANEKNEGLFVDIISSAYQITKMLNDEIEIIEEDKEIEKINSIKVPTISNSREKNIENIEETLNKYWFVINKLAEAVNELKKGK